MSGKKTRFEIEEEKKKWQMKSFDYAENPIKDWISVHLGEKPNILFPDYTEQLDKLIFTVDGKTYSFYLSAKAESPNNKHFEISQKLFSDTTKFKQAVSVLYDSVYNVYGMIINSSISPVRNNMLCIRPNFDEKKMAFTFLRVNKSDFEKKNALNPIQEIDHYLKLINENKNDTKWDEKQKNEMVKQEKELHKLKIKQINEYNAISDETVKTEQVLCNKINKEFQNGPFLYICAKVNEEVSYNLLTRRLPEFGERYVDPDEDGDIVVEVEKRLDEENKRQETAKQSS